MTMLHHRFLSACERGSVYTVASLLDQINPSVNDNRAIHLASYNGHTEIVRLLLGDPSVDPSSDHNYALRSACYNGHIEVVRLLLADPRVDLSCLDNWAMQYAKQEGHTEIIDLLTEHQFRLDGPEYNKNILT